MKYDLKVPEHKKKKKKSEKKESFHLMCAEKTVLRDSTNQLRKYLQKLRFEFNLALSRIPENLLNLYLLYITMKFIIYIT